MKIRRSVSKASTCTITKGLVVVFLVALLSTFYEFQQSAQSVDSLALYEQEGRDHPRNLAADPSQEFRPKKKGVGKKRRQKDALPLTNPGWTRQQQEESEEDVEDADELEYLGMGATPDEKTDSEEEEEDSAVNEDEIAVLEFTLARLKEKGKLKKNKRKSLPVATVPAAANNKETTPATEESAEKDAQEEATTDPPAEVQVTPIKKKGKKRKAKTKKNQVENESTNTGNANADEEPTDSSVVTEVAAATAKESPPEQEEGEEMNEQEGEDVDEDLLKRQFEMELNEDGGELEEEKEEEPVADEEPVAKEAPKKRKQKRKNKGKNKGKTKPVAEETVTQETTPEETTNEQTTEENPANNEEAAEAPPVLAEEENKPEAQPTKKRNKKKKGRNNNKNKKVVPQEEAAVKEEETAEESGEAKSDNENVAETAESETPEVEEGNEESGGEVGTTETPTWFSLPIVEVPEEVEIMIQQAMEQRNLTIWKNGDTIKNILRHVWLKDNAYSKENDFVVFFHPMKSGGTTVSAILDKVGGVLPGSHGSGHFDNKKWKDKFGVDSERTGISKPDWWAKYKVIYSHHPYRRPAAPDSHTPTGNAQHLYRLVKAESTKRARHVTMVRDPLSFVASNMNEWICRNAKWQRKARQYGWPETDSPNACYGYTLSNLADVRIQSNTYECANKTFAELKKLKTMKRRMICKAFQAGKKDDTPECRSATDFMKKYEYREKVIQHMNHYPRYVKAEIPMEDYIANSMGYLGGVDTMRTDSETGATSHYGDMMWFGITERMKESMCLLHYHLQVPYVKTPRKRVQECRPTTYWTDEEKEIFNKREPLALYLHQAANAVLDVQVAKMKQDIKLRLQETGAEGTSTKEFPFVPTDCWMDETAEVAATK